MPALNGTGNVLLTDDVIAKKALVLLKNNLVLAPLVYRDNLQATFGNVGDTISLKLPYRTRTASGRTLVKQPMVDKTIPFVLDRQEHFGLEYTVKDKSLTIDQFADRYLKSGMIQLANKVDRSIALQLKSGFFSSEMAGSSVIVKDFLLSYAYQTDVAVPDDGMRRAVLAPLDGAEISDDISKSYQPEMVKGAIQKGYKGPLANYDVFETQNLYTHTVGDYSGTPLSNGADQTGSSIVTDGWTIGVTGLLKEGDVITFAGVHEINPQSYASTGRLQKFVVTADVTSDGSGNATISVSPSINDGTLTTVDSEGTTVSTKGYQNVDSAVADGAAISVVGTANKTYRQAFMFHRDAIGLAVANLELPKTAASAQVVRDPESGLALSMTGDYDITNHTEIHRIDIIWGTHAIYPELIHRLFTEDLG